MAADQTWEKIQRSGLRPTSYFVARDPQSAGVARRRPTTQHLEDRELGPITIRDQRALNPKLLSELLDEGMTVDEWIALLNDRVFFWLDFDKLSNFVTVYGKEPQTVITINTKELLARHGDKIELSPINTGSASWRNAPRRGPKTFVTIADCPFEDWLKQDPVHPIEELVVVGGVPDIKNFTIAVDRIQRLWTAPKKKTKKTPSARPIRKV